MLVLAMEEGDMIPNKSTKLFWLLVVCVCYVIAKCRDRHQPPLLSFLFLTLPFLLLSSQVF